MPDGWGRNMLTIANSATVSGGIYGGVIGTLAGTAGVILAQRRYPAFRGLTVPFRTFLACSTGTFSGTLIPYL